MATPKGQPNVTRYVIALLVIVGGLYSLVFFTGDRQPTPKLGLDLIGGTTARLTATTPDGKAPPADQLEQARQIIANRVDGLGVAEAQVVTEGNNQIVISVAGQNNDALKSVAQPAQLRFREVEATVADATAAAAAAAASASPSPSVSGSASPSGSAAPSGSPSSSASPSASSSAQVANPSSSAGSGTGGGNAATASPTPSAQSSASPSASPSASASASAAATPSPSGSAAALPAAVTELAKAVDEASAEDLASFLQSVEQDPATAVATPDFAPFKELTGDQVAQLSAKVQFYLPTISCDQLDARPAGSIDGVDQQVTACGQGQKYLLKAAKVVGTDVDTAGAAVSQQGAGWEVVLEFTGSGQKKWTDLTTATVGKQVAVVLDKDVVSAPTIQDVIPGDAQITGSFTQREAQTLASQLRFGALPLTFEVPEAQTISATLGTEQLRAGLIAGAIGLALVVLYAMFYYRLTGIVILFSLILSAGIVYALLVLLGRQIGFTLTLAGVAGFVVSLGIAADSFVIYFERLKDEIREGRSPRSAVPRAWVRARRTIISANVVSFLAAAVLYVLAIGAVKGFAFTLGLSTIVDLMIVFLFRHPIMSALARTKMFLSPRVSGLGRVIHHDEPEQPKRQRRAREA